MITLLLLKKNMFMPVVKGCSADFIQRDYSSVVV
jgi:hypothetical protein